MIPKLNADQIAQIKKGYHFTPQQLEEHDRIVRKRAIEQKMDDLRQYSKQIIEHDFNERQKLLEGSTADVTGNIFSMLVSVPCRVLVRDFGWTPIYDNGHAERTKLAKFMRAVQEEAEQLLNDELLDIRKYSEQVFEETGIKLELKEEE